MIAQPMKQNRKAQKLSSWPLPPQRVGLQRLRRGERLEGEGRGTCLLGIWWLTYGWSAFGAGAQGSGTPWNDGGGVDGKGVPVYEGGGV